MSFLQEKLPSQVKPKKKFMKKFAKDASETTNKFLARQSI